jgi:hypothetical protein
MPGELVCWKCGHSLAEYTLPLRRLEICRECNAELHVCRLCRFYDTSKAKHCAEPIAEEVRDKESANFCDYFAPRPDAHSTQGQSEADAARRQLDALFGGGAASDATPDSQDSEADAARRALDDLFKGSSRQ